jgi:hypothetical protein
MSDRRDCTPRIPWDSPAERRRPVGQRIRDILLAEPDETLVDALALQGLDNEMEAETYRDLFLRAVRELRRERALRHELQDQLRAWVERA